MASQRQDLLFIVFIMIFVSMFIIPVPVLVIDILIAFNMTFTILVLISATYLKNTLELSTFPSIILFSTVFRLSLTVATARLILANGDAGKIIDSFGKFVVSGNLVVGLVVFFIVAIVQFIVVVKGSERIAEVSARFTLDALPGKQMSIDSDLRAGDISKDEARVKRMTLEQESQFFGAMDGAMRFVKGDAIAGFVVIFINLIGGLSVGMAIKGLSFGAAIHKYSLLSVGDGLVAQIPAMFVSIAAGTVVTRVNTDESRHIGTDIFRELGTKPKTLAVAAVIMAVIGMLPGFPTVLFFILAGMLAGGAYMLNKRPEKGASGVAGAGGEDDDDDGFPNTDQAMPLRPAERGDTFTVVASPSMLQQLESTGGGNFIAEKKQALMMELGLPMPDVGFRADPNIPPELWRLDVEDVPTYKGKYQADWIRVYAPQERIVEVGSEPIIQESDTGVPEIWVTREQAQPVAQAGMRIAHPSDVFADDLIHQVRRYASRAFGLGEAQGWLQMLEGRHGPLAQNVQQTIPPLKIVEMMRILLDEGIPLAQSRVLLETLLMYGSPEASGRELADVVRLALRSQIASQISDENSNINCIAIGPNMEAQLRSPQNFGFGQSSIPDPRPALERISRRTIEVLHKYNENPPRAIVTSPDVRELVQGMISAKGFHLMVLSTIDIPTGFNMNFIAIIQEDEVVYPEAQVENSTEDEAENI